MFAFDTDYDLVTPSAGQLIAELGLDTRSVRDAIADDRARRCPDCEALADRVELIGRLGADVTVNHLVSGGRVANLSVATDESYIDRNSGVKVDRTEWHRIVTFQDGLIDMLDKHAKKGRLVHAEGKLQTRRWSKPDEDGDRFSTEILVVPGHRIQFLDKPNGNGDPASTPVNGGTPAQVDDMDSEPIPF